MLNYTDEGSGEAIVFLHGMAASSRYWEAFIPLLKDTHRLVRLDLLGFGKSPQTANGYDVSNHCQAIEETLKHLEIDGSFTLVGHSMGALLALKYAARHPEQISKLVLISMPIYSSPEQARLDITKSKKMLKYAYYGPSSHLLCTTWCYVLRPLSKRVAPFYLRSQPRHVAEDSVLHTWRAYSECMHYIIEQQAVEDDMQKLKMPVELVYGSAESPIVLRNANLMQVKNNIHRLKLDGSHNLPLEQPERLSRLMAKQAAISNR